MASSEGQRAANSLFKLVLAKWAGNIKTNQTVNVPRNILTTIQEIMMEGSTTQVRFSCTYYIHIRDF